MRKRDMMLWALRLARKGRGRTAPNPCVGAVLCKGDRVIGQGWHEAYGREHAEVRAIEDARAAGEDPAGASLWVTLEPCNHQGKTPPCSRAILDAGIERVYVGTPDPNPDAEGGGIEFLRKSGVCVETGIEQQQCRDLIRDFICWRLEGRPYLRLKLAATLDGKIGSGQGAPGWVSGEKAWREVHQLRAMSQAVLIGGNTLYADDPLLTCRLPDQKDSPQPLAVVLTSRLPGEDSSYRLLRDRPQNTVIWTTFQAAGTPQADRLRAGGVEVWPLGQLPSGGVDLASGLKQLFSRYSCFEVLCEGGGRLAYSLCEQGLADEIIYFLAPRILGDEMAPSAFAGRTAPGMEQALRYRITEHRKVGEDLRLTMRPPQEGGYTG